jgi:hypothetical protein
MKKIAFPVVFFIASCASMTKAQEKALSYTIKTDGQSVGTLNIMKAALGNKICYKLKSEVKTKFIFTYVANGIEEAVYENGILVYSSVYQKLNGKEKLNKQIKRSGDKYFVTEKGSQKFLPDTIIGFNMICLYSNEPVHTSQVFSDKFQKHLPIQKVGEHHYKVSFPGGHYNEYYYSNGVCTRIEVNHSLYNAIMELHQ